MAEKPDGARDLRAVLRNPLLSSCGQSSAASVESSPAVAPSPAQAEKEQLKDAAAAAPAGTPAAQPAPSSTTATGSSAAPSDSATQQSSDSASNASAKAPPPSDLDQHLDHAAALEEKLQAMASTTHAVATNKQAEGSASPSGDASTPPAAWKSFTQAQLDAIEAARAAVRAKGPLVMDPKGTYGLICRACTKPNSTNVTFCTGCGFPSTPEDIQRLPDNIRYRDDNIVAFDDKFAVSDNHLDVIPTAVYADCTVLTREHIPMLEKLYDTGRAEFLKRNLAWLPKDQDIDDFITAGYNYPVSVKHLHLHMVLPPFRHEKVFQYPRWHAHKKIIADLNEFGLVKLYCDQPNDEEGANEYNRAMKNNEKVKQLIKDLEEKNNNAAATTSTPTADGSAAP